MEWRVIKDQCLGETTYNGDYHYQVCVKAGQIIVGVPEDMFFDTYAGKGVTVPIGNNNLKVPVSNLEQVKDESIIIAGLNLDLKTILIVLVLGFIGWKLFKK